MREQRRVLCLECVKKNNANILDVNILKNKTELNAKGSSNLDSHGSKLLQFKSSLVTFALCNDPVLL